jgi:hypothetical protein
MTKHKILIFCFYRNRRLTATVFSTNWRRWLWTAKFKNDFFSSERKSFLIEKSNIWLHTETVAGKCSTELTSEVTINNLKSDSVDGPSLNPNPLCYQNVNKENRITVNFLASLNGHSNTPMWLHTFINIYGVLIC